MFSTRSLASLAVGITIFAIGFLFAVNSPKIYQATGIVQLLDHAEEPISIEQGLELFTSSEIANAVASRMVSDIQSGRLSKIIPEMNPEDTVEPSTEVLMKNSHFSQIRHSKAIRVSYESRDPEIAAYLCNRYMDEYVNYWLTKHIDQSMKRVEDLRIRADKAKERVEQAEVKLAQIKEARSTAAPDQIEALDQQYEALLERFEQAQEDLQELVKEMTQEKAMVTLKIPSVRILENATVPETHIRPNLLLWSLASAIAGLFGAMVCFKLMAKPIIRALVNDE